jgi:hypothetical protein
MKGASMKRAAIAALLAALAGCGAPERSPDRQVNLGGYSGSFKQGYADGCESAGARGQRRDETRFKTEADYMMGWNDGYSVCRRRR